MKGWERGGAGQGRGRHPQERVGEQDHGGQGLPRLTGVSLGQREPDGEMWAMVFEPEVHKCSFLVPFSQFRRQGGMTVLFVSIKQKTLKCLLLRVGFPVTWDSQNEVPTSTEGGKEASPDPTLLWVSSATCRVPSLLTGLSLCSGMRAPRVKRRGCWSPRRDSFRKRALTSAPHQQTAETVTAS